MDEHIELTSSPGSTQSLMFTRLHADTGRASLISRAKNPLQNPEPTEETQIEKGMTLAETQTESRVVSAKPAGSKELSSLIEQYGCGPAQFTGTNDALYERHLVFDNVMDAAAIGARERFEAIARSVRDVLSQRWIRTEETYDRKDPKRVYYLSMEFLVGRSLAKQCHEPST